MPIFFGVKVYLTPKALKKRPDFNRLLYAREEKLFTKCFRKLFEYAEVKLIHEC
jgi:hypothetical protein